jgi:hypothetical protein
MQNTGAQSAGRRRDGAQRAAAMLLVVALASCRAVPAPSEPRLDPRSVTPPELLPDDLDFVVRIDAARIRENPMLTAAVRDLAKASGSGMLDSVKSAFEDATAIWIGTRWMSDGFHGDGVLAIERVPGSDPRSTAPERDIAVIERPVRGRGDAALEIVLRGRGVVLATAAEADAILRVMRTSPDRSRLDPPAQGLVSFAGRMRPGTPIDVVAQSTLRELMQGLVGYTGSIEDRAAIEVEASLSYRSATDAKRAADKAKDAVARLGAIEGTLGTVANSVKLTEIGSSLRVRAEVPFACLAELH